MTDKPTIPAAKNEEQLDLIREILLKPDRSQIKELKFILETREKLHEKVHPIIEDQIVFIQENFPDVFGKQVDKAIEKKITESPELLLSILSPVLGRLIRKGIAQQFQQLREHIDNQLRSIFSRKGLLGRIKARLFGLKEGDVLLSELDEYTTVLKEIYVIQRHSGLLLANFSKGETMDRDMIGGMMTAIKSFMEDAIKDDEEGAEDELEMIQYGVYKIFIQNFYNYYIAAVMMGDLTTSDKEELADAIIRFAELEIKSVPKVIDQNFFSDLSERLERYFKDY